MRTHNEPNERLFDDLITSEYITTAKNDYSLTVTYYGAFNEDDEPDTAGATGACIDINEITGRNPETITAIYNALKDDFESAEIDEYTIMVYAPERRKFASFEDYDSEAHTIETTERIKKILEAIEG